MKKTAMTIATIAVLIVAFVFMVGMAYYVGKPVYDGIVENGWAATFGAIDAGIIVGLVMWAAYNVPGLIYKRLHKSK